MPGNDPGEGPLDPSPVLGQGRLVFAYLGGGISFQNFGVICCQSPVVVHS